MKSRQAGYTVAEMLTVVAIIGLFSLVSVPSFITFRNTSKVKSSVRNFLGDLRAARQLAISSGLQTKLGYTPGTNGARNYNIYKGDSPFGPVASVTWKPLPQRRGVKYLDDIVYFPSKTGQIAQDFVDYNSDNELDIVFYPDGAVKMPTSTAASATITVQTDRAIPKKQYKIILSPSGRVMTQ